MNEQMPIVGGENLRALVEIIDRSIGRGENRRRWTMSVIVNLNEIVVDLNGMNIELKVFLSQFADVLFDLASHRLNGLNVFRQEILFVNQHGQGRSDPVDFFALPVEHVGHVSIELATFPLVESIDQVITIHSPLLELLSRILDDRLDVRGGQPIVQGIHSIGQLIENSFVILRRFIGEIVVLRTLLRGRHRHDTRLAQVEERLEKNFVFERFLAERRKENSQPRSRERVRCFFSPRFYFSEKSSTGDVSAKILARRE